MKRWIPLALAAALAPATAFGAVVVNDSFADGGRNNGADPQDADWWYSTGSTAIEVSAGSLGLVTGTSGRGIHGTFPAQSLGVGDTLTATYTFVTPATITATGTTSSFRVGLFDTTGKPGLAADISASSGTPNAVYNNLLGYMMDYDVNAATTDVTFRERTNAASGQLMAATGDYTSLSPASGGSPYTFAPNTTYVGTISVTRTAAGLDFTGTLSQGATLLSTFTTSDATPTATTFGMLAFHVNSNTFGSSGTPGAADNGIDFTNISIDVTQVPEPATLGTLALAALGALRRRRA
jgi:hypothetical protein